MIGFFEKVQLGKNVSRRQQKLETSMLLLDLSAIVCLFGLWFYVSVNSYGHFETAS